MLLEFQEWKAHAERERCLLTGLPLPPAAPAPQLLEAAPAGDATAVAQAVAPPPAVAAAPVRKRVVKPISWAHALTKQQLLALLDRQSEAAVWAKLCAEEEASKAAAR